MAMFSVSKIGTFDTCPLQYRLAYIDRIKVEAEDTVEAFLGSRVHEALEKLYRDKRHEKLLSLDELLVHYNKLWEKNWNERIIIVKKEYTEENYRRMGEKYLTDYYNRYKPFDAGRVIGLETKEMTPLDEEGNYMFHIRIDRLMDMSNGVYEVHDYKTGLNLPKQEDLDMDKQLAMYSLWVTQRFKDFKKVRLVWHFLAFDKEMDSFRTREQLEKLRGEVLERIREIETAEEYPANVSWLCDWCLYKNACPMWRHGVELEEKPENEYLNDPGLELVDKYVKVKEALDEHKKEAEDELKKLREALISFCEKERVQVVFGSQNKVTVKESEYIRFPGKDTEERKELVEVLEKMGKLKDVSEPDNFALARALKNKEWDAKDLEFLERFASREKSFRLTVSKHQKGETFSPDSNGNTE